MSRISRVWEAAQAAEAARLAAARTGSENLEAPRTIDEDVERLVPHTRRFLRELGETAILSEGQQAASEDARP
jgi:hypothetical protein